MEFVLCAFLWIFYPKILYISFFIGVELPIKYICSCCNDWEILFLRQAMSSLKLVQHLKGKTKPPQILLIVDILKGVRKNRESYYFCLGFTKTVEINQHTCYKKRFIWHLYNVFEEVEYTFNKKWQLVVSDSSNYPI